MSIGQVYRQGKYSEFNNTFEVSRQSGLLILLDDLKAADNIDLLLKRDNNYIFIILNGHEEALISKFKSLGISEKPRGVFVISKKTEEIYYNDIPNLIPCNEKWNLNTSELFNLLKNENREFFSKL
jgi:hypothetical protein